MENRLLFLGSFLAMFNRTNIQLSLWSLFFVLILLISGCDDEIRPSGNNKNAILVVDHRFAEFYDWLGGEEVIGPIISKIFSHGNNEYQYTAAILMVFVPDANSTDRFQVAPLGLELGVAQPPTNPDSPFGHEVHPDFMDMYIQLGGVRIVGLPLHEAYYNAELGRIEQVYENMGFYQLVNTLPGDVKLLDIGAWKCGEKCGYTSPAERRVQPHQTFDSPFTTAISRLDPSFSGQPLTGPFIAPDGNIEQIFENIVVMAAPDYPGGIRLRPLLELLGVDAQAGIYSVPEFFMEYINRNSGLELSGNPISEYQTFSSDVSRQCFENLCLDFYANFPEELQVQPAPLGYTYKNLYYPNE